MTIHMSPCILPGCPTRFAEYDPVRYFLFGGMVMSELVSSNLEDEDLMSAEQLLKIVHEVKKKKPLCLHLYPP